MLGTVRSLDRTNQIANCYLDGSQLLVPAPYLGDPPPPLSKVDLAQPARGKYVCRGPQLDSRVILHDDFLVAGVNAAPFGDTNWTAHNTSGFTGYGQETVYPAVGATRITSVATANNWGSISKDDSCVSVPTAPAGLWFSGRVTTSVITNSLIGCGFTNGAFSGGASNHYCALYYRTDLGNVNWTLLTQHANGAQTYLATANAPVVGTYIDFDIVLLGGVFAAIWINNDGPYITNNASVPAVADLMTPHLASYSLVAASQTIICDWVHVERVAKIEDPTRLPPGPSPVRGF